MQQNLTKEQIRSLRIIDAYFPELKNPNWVPLPSHLQPQMPPEMLQRIIDFIRLN